MQQFYKFVHIKLCSRNEKIQKFETDKKSYEYITCCQHHDCTAKYHIIDNQELAPLVFFLGQQSGEIYQFLISSAPFIFITSHVGGYGSHRFISFPTSSYEERNLIFLFRHAELYKHFLAVFLTLSFRRGENRERIKEVVEAEGTGTNLRLICLLHGLKCSVLRSL